MSTDATIECHSCQQIIPFEESFAEVADEGSWWEQRWYFCGSCRPENSGAVTEVEQ